MIVKSLTWRDRNLRFERAQYEFFDHFFFAYLSRNRIPAARNMEVVGEFVAINVKKIIIQQNRQ